jgi:hypothetical protein
VIHPVGSALHRENEKIQQTVVVVIDKTDPAACSLDDELLRCRSTVWKDIGQARLPRNIPKIGNEKRKDC